GEHASDLLTDAGSATRHHRKAGSSCHAVTITIIDGDLIRASALGRSGRRDGEIRPQRATRSAAAKGTPSRLPAG
ncbi:hypothetical protein, partial [Actinoplanes aureus]|uniref:hypothetical protein n=1 Tax=Actinoplanes aureus TaxID=2792083 RepID=UPI001E51135B